MRISKILMRGINKPQLIGIVVALIVDILSLIFLRGNDVFYFILGISVVIAGFPFFISLILETNSEREKEEMFLEFARNLVENVKVGTPISKGILNIRKKDFGKLNPYIDKLANQISLGIPLTSALETFARDVDNTTITRSVTIISESEKAGGEIETILEAVVKSVSQVDKLKKERRAAMYSLVVQGYIIFFIFIIIMLIMQFQILPIASGLQTSVGSAGNSGAGIGMGFETFFSGGATAGPEELSRPFLWLLVTQGFFAGLVIGKLAEGRVKSGLKHSFVLVILALLINTGAKLFLG